MADFITKQQKADIEYAEMEHYSFFLEKLRKYAGIRAVPYIAYHFYDKNMRYIGDSNGKSLNELLDAAHIEVRDA